MSVGQTGSIDFDGVLNSYKGWRGPEVIDAPVPGAQEFMRDLLVWGFEPIISSTRASSAAGSAAIHEWLRRYDFPPEMHVTWEKVPALFSLDDRALRFEGRFPTRDEIEAACVPWNRR